MLSVGRTWSLEPSNNDTSGELRVIAFNDPPYISVVRQEDGSFHFDGYLYELWTTIAHELNLSYRMVALENIGYGNIDLNGTWNGLAGELAYGRADVALTWMNMRLDRARVIDYISAVPVVQSQITFYVQQGFEGMPQFVVDMFCSLLKPLHENVWWALLASLFVVSVVLRVTIRFNHERAESRQTVAEMTWGSCLFYSFMSGVRQGWATTPDSLAARIVTIFSWVLGTIIYVNYTANLISYLTVTEVDKPISSLQELSEQAGWTFATEPGVGALNDWRVSADTYERELYQRVTHKKGFIDLDGSVEALRSALQPKVVFYTDINRMFFNFGTEACAAVPLLDRPPAKSNTYMLMTKGRKKIQGDINQMMRLLNQAGTVSRLQAHWLRTGSDLCAAPTGFKELSLADVLAMLVLVPLAIIASAVIFGLEWLWARWKAGRRRTQVWQSEQYPSPRKGDTKTRLWGKCIARD